MNKSIEIEIELFHRMKDNWRWFSLLIELTEKVDHAGFKLYLDLLKVFGFRFSFYDHRHWNDWEDRWYRSGEVEIDMFGDPRDSH